MDIFPVKDRDYDRTALGRIRRDSLDPKHPADTYYQAAPEDVVLGKLEWFRLGEEVSERQWHDVLGVLRLNSRKS